MRSLPLSSSESLPACLEKAVEQVEYVQVMCQRVCQGSTKQEHKRDSRLWLWCTCSAQVVWSFMYGFLFVRVCLAYVYVYQH